MLLMRALYLLLPLCLFLSVSCTSLNQSCLSLNWYELGHQDSTKDSSLKESFKKRQNSCYVPKKSIYAKAYRNGFESGLRQYCSFKTGYMSSMYEEKESSSACPQELKSQFDRGYEIGSRMKIIDSLQNELEGKINQLKQSLKNKDTRFSKQGN